VFRTPGQRILSRGRRLNRPAAEIFDPAGNFSDPAGNFFDPAGDFIRLAPAIDRPAPGLFDLTLNSCAWPDSFARAGNRREREAMRVFDENLITNSGGAMRARCV
jgi:hypothetical protein